MLRATTPAVEGRRILSRDGVAGIRDLVGGRPAAHQERLCTTRTIARRAMDAAAEPTGTLLMSAGGSAGVGE